MNDLKTRAEFISLLPLHPELFKELRKIFTMLQTDIDCAEPQTEKEEITGNGQSDSI